MTRRSLFPLAAFFVTLGVAAAPAIAKPKVAVLGLEVIDNGTMDARTTLRGKQMTNKLRDQAGRSAGKFEMAPNSDKDLLEMKLLSNCSDEAHSCMAQIGRELGAEKLVYGKIERQQNGYFIQLKMLDTTSGKLDKTSNRVLPFTDHRQDKLTEHAAALYRRLTGEPELGVLVLKVKNANKGTVYLDGDVKTSLAAGSATIRDVSEGKHTIAIESDGFERYNKEVTVAGGKAQEMSIKLSSIEGPSGGGRGGSKVLAVGGAAIAVGGAVGMVVTGLRVRDAREEKKVSLEPARAELDMGMNNAFDSERFRINACDEAKANRDTTFAGDDTIALISACDKGQDNSFLFNYVFLPGTIVGALAAGYFGYRGFLAADDDVLEQPVGSKRRKKPRRRVKIEPLFGPDGVAASVRVEF